MAKVKNYILDDSIGYLVGTTARALGSQLSKNLNVTGSGVTFEQWSLLVRLWENDGQSQQDIANVCNKDKTTITRLIDNLEKQNIVVRIEDKSDRRNKLIYLTSLGKSLQDKLIPVAKKTIDEAQNGITEQDLEICKKVLRQIKENISRVGCKYNKC